MKTTILSAFVIFVLASCGTSDQPQAEQQQAGKPAPPAKFILRAAGDKYVTVSPDNFALIANQSDAAKTDTFEIMELQNGKSALKVKGKFVSADRDKGGSLVANREKAHSWESFEIFGLDENKINFKDSNGKFVCADLNMGGILIADRDKAGDWERFTVEAK